MRHRSGGGGGGEQNKGVINEHQVPTLYKALVQAVLVRYLGRWFLKYEGSKKHCRVDQTSSQRCLLPDCFPVSLGKWKAGGSPGYHFAGFWAVFFFFSLPCACRYRCMHVHMHKTTGLPAVCQPQTPFLRTACLETGTLTGTWTSRSQLGCLASKPQAPFSSHCCD